MMRFVKTTLITIDTHTKHPVEARASVFCSRDEQLEELKAGCHRNQVKAQNTQRFV
jgi:hypothetical protein